MWSLHYRVKQQDNSIEDFVHGYSLLWELEEISHSEFSYVFAVTYGVQVTVGMYPEMSGLTHRTMLRVLTCEGMWGYAVQNGLVFPKKNCHWFHFIQKKKKNPYRWVPFYENGKNL